MQKQGIIGIDVSKLTLDLWIDTQGHQTIKNTKGDIKRFFTGLADTNWLIAMENTGNYNYYLYDVLTELGLCFYVLNPLQLKKSTGIVRSKTDKDDARMIAEHISKHHQELSPFDPYTSDIIQLKALLSERKQRITDRKKYSVKVKEYQFINGKNKGQLEELRQQMVDAINTQIKVIEQQIKELIRSNDDLQKKAELMCSIPGVGKVLCWTLLAKTNGMRNVNTPRKMACFAGVVPFMHQSGTSLNYRPRVSYYADKTLKQLLHMAAMSAIQKENDLQHYYQRKVAEGKNKMSVLNAVRNKLIHRIYAVIKQQKMYQPYLLKS